MRNSSIVPFRTQCGLKAREMHCISQWYLHSCQPSPVSVASSPRNALHITMISFEKCIAYHNDNFTVVNLLLSVLQGHFFRFHSRSLSPKLLSCLSLWEFPVMTSCLASFGKKSVHLWHQQVLTPQRKTSVVTFPAENRYCLLCLMYPSECACKGGPDSDGWLWGGW